MCYSVDLATIYLLTVNILHQFAVFPAQLEIVVGYDLRVDGVHDGVVARRVEQAECVADLVHGHLHQVGALVRAHGQVLVVVDVDLGVGRHLDGVRQLAAEPVEVVGAVQVLSWWGDEKEN